MKKLLILFIFGFPFKGFTQSIDLNTTRIPEALTVNACAVMRYEHTQFEIKKDDKANMKVEYAMTILNDNGIRYSPLVVPYTEFSKVTSINATVYDANGDKVKRISKSDIYDISAISGYSLYEDSRIKAIDPEYRVTPFTVVYSYEIDFSGTLNLPVWQPYKSTNISVEEATFTLTFPDDYNLRYLEENISVEPENGMEKDKQWIKWQINNLEALLDENFHSMDYDVLPKVYTAPSAFSLDGHKGDMTTWENFGKWVYNLLEGTSNLPEETKLKVQEMTAGMSDKEKVETLYDYLQEKTRYVSIQAGIGGWKPFEASMVDEYSYGDCKALSNYMISVLDAAGIKAYYTLVKAGNEKPAMMDHFPSNQFNHAIVMVPLEEDSLWLECTSQKIPFNYLGTFTDDRQVLLITEEGGKLTTTPEYTADQNRRVSHSIFHLNETGATASVKMENFGLFYERMSKLESMDVQKKQRVIKQNFNIPAFEISSYTTAFPEPNQPAYQLEMELKINELSSKIRGRLIVPIQALATEMDNAAQRADRRSDIYIPRSYSLIDTVVYKYTDQYTLSMCPENIQMDTDYGNFTLTFKQGEEGMMYIRKLNIRKGVYAGNKYEEFASFIAGIQNANNLKFVLEEKEL